MLKQQILIVLFQLQRQMIFLRNVPIATVSDSHRMINFPDSVWYPPSVTPVRMLDAT